MNIPLVDLKAQYESIKEEIDEAVRRVIERGEFILGSEVEAFEEEMAGYLGVKYAIGVASGTDALQLALLACGVGPGEGVITTPFTFIATTEAIVQCGARPVFADIDPRTYNLNPQEVFDLLGSRQSAVNSRQSTVRSQEPRVKSQESRVSSRQSGLPDYRPSTIDRRLSAILPVHLYGQPVDMDPILELARQHDLRVIEDCAQALGATYDSRQSTVDSQQSRDKSRQSGVGSQRSRVSSQQSAVDSPPPPLQTSDPDYRLSTIDQRPGRKVGSLGDAGCLSFFPSKVLGAYGDGGMVVTNNAAIAEKVRILRNHGCKQKYYHLTPGFNSRLDELQAAILRVKLRHLDSWIEQRQRKAAQYTELLGQIQGIEPPFVAPYGDHVFNYYTIRVSKSRTGRNKLREHLAAQGIATAIYYPLCLHLQEVHQDLGYSTGDFLNSEKAQHEILSLPIYPELTQEQVEWIADEVKQGVE